LRHPGTGLLQAEELGAKLVGRRVEQALDLDAGAARSVEADEVEGHAVHEGEVVGNVSGAAPRA
jgi:hypothetical protein